MLAKEYDSDRKRSRPVTKKKKSDVLKKNLALTIFIVLIIAIIAIAGVAFLLTNSEDNTVKENNNNDNNGTATGVLVAKNDDYTIFKHSVNNVLNVMANDEDANKSSLNIISVGNPKYGDVTISGNNVLYTPGENFNNDESFTYTVMNEVNNSATATVKVNMRPTAILGTSKGTISIGLYDDKVPNTCDNFIKLANSGFYEGLIFHRVIPNFMVQCGGFNPDGTQKESPYGAIDLEINSEVRHVDGAISMARTSDPNSATSQFFICDGAQSFLDDNYAAFGVVVSGMDIVRAIASVDTDTKYTMENWPVDDVVINSLTIEEY